MSLEPNCDYSALEVVSVVSVSLVTCMHNLTLTLKGSPDVSSSKDLALNF